MSARHVNVPAVDEPEVGSVIMLHGPSGTAWQRLRSDGLWHSVTGEVADWDGVLAAAGTRSPIVILEVTVVDSGSDTI